MNGLEHLLQTGLFRSYVSDMLSVYDAVSFLMTTLRMADSAHKCLILLRERQEKEKIMWTEKNLMSVSLEVEPLSQRLRERTEEDLIRFIMIMNKRIDRKMKWQFIPDAAEELGAKAFSIFSSCSGRKTVEFYPRSILGHRHGYNKINSEYDSMSGLALEVRDVISALGGDTRKTFYLCRARGNNDPMPSSADMLNMFYGPG